MTEFEDAIRLTAAGSSTSEGWLWDGWAVGGAANGGLLMALAATALRDRLVGAGAAPGHTDPVALSAYFLSPAGEGPVRATCEPVRLGRTLSTGQVSLLQDGSEGPVERLRALGSFGDLSSLAGAVLRTPDPPDIPPPDQCVTADAMPAEFRRQIRLLERVELRFDPATAGWASGQPSRQGRIRAWIRFADRQPVDTFSLLFFLDALPPVSFDLGILGWAPTLEFTGHVRARPVDGWLLAEILTETVTATVMEEDARVWDATGRLVAQSRQLAGIRMPAKT